MRSLFFIALSLCCLSQPFIHAKAIQEEKRLLDGLLGGLLGTVTGLVTTLTGVVTGLLKSVLGVLSITTCLGSLTGGLLGNLQISKLCDLTKILGTVTELKLVGNILGTVTGLTGSLTTVLGSLVDKATGEIVPGVLGSVLSLTGCVVGTVQGLTGSLLGGPLGAILKTIPGAVLSSVDLTSIFNNLNLGGGSDGSTYDGSLDLCTDILKGVSLTQLPKAVFDKACASGCTITNTVTGAVLPVCSMDAVKSACAA